MAHHLLLRIACVYLWLEYNYSLAGECRSLDAAYQFLGLARGVQIVAEFLLRGQPVAQKHIGFAVLQRLIADGNRQRGDIGRIAQTAKQGGGESEWQKDRRVDFVELRKQ